MCNSMCRPGHYQRYGMRVIKPIAATERTPGILAEMRDIRCHASVETIYAALSEASREENIFALCQPLALFDCHQTKVLEYDRKLEVENIKATRASGASCRAGKTISPGRIVSVEHPDPGAWDDDQRIYPNNASGSTRELHPLSQVVDAIIVNLIEP